MHRFAKPRALFLFGFFNALLLVAAPRAGAADGCSPAEFTAARAFEGGVNEYTLFRPVYAAADLNGDGRTDLIAIDGVGFALVHLNAGGGRFEASRRFAVGAVPSAVAVADFNATVRPTSSSRLPSVSR